MIKIELLNEYGDTETITKEFVSGRDFRNVVQFASKVEREKTSEAEQIDELIHLVVNLFKDEKVTFDTILDGTEASELAPTLQKVIEGVMGGEGKKPGNKKK